MTELERIRDDCSAGKPLSSDDCWFLIEEISRYRELLRRARYQTISVSVTTKQPSDGGEPVVIANVVASEEATERAIIREFRRTWIRLIRAGQRDELKEAAGRIER